MCSRSLFLIFFGEKFLGFTVNFKAGDREIRLDLNNGWMDFDFMKAIQLTDHDEYIQENLGNLSINLPADAPLARSLAI